MKIKYLLLALICACGTKATYAQIPNPPEHNDFPELEWRNIGPFRGGRSAAVVGHPSDPNRFYFGSTGGGVWQSDDAGQTWFNISDGYFGGSIGSIAVSDWDPNVMYVGGGEVTVRGNVSYGYGVYKSTDAGKSWKHVGLPNSCHIPRIRIHPKDPNLVYAAVLGDLFKRTPDRGVYRSKDGGETWEKVLFANEDAGAVDLYMDPTNPRVLYASTWHVRRTPYSLISGGPGSDLWKSTDGGDSWQKLSDNPGFANGPLGIIGVAASPSRPERVYAIVEAPEGGVLRSDDGGKSWRRTNSDRSLRQRAWYYSRIYTHPTDADQIYIMNVSYHHSKDGGKTFRSSCAPHGDHHDLWINPNDPNRMVIADDGGAQVTLDAGDNWSTYHNQPTAQFYRVVTDEHFPYRVYGAQQDNSTIRILSRKDGGNIGERDWEESAGGESAHLAADPRNNEVVYGGSYGGFLTRYNHANDQSRIINIWPDNPLGAGVESMKYRFQWNFPVFISPHDPNVLYATSNHVHRSTDGGQSWEVISPDLTRNDSARMVSSGGPITQDNTGVEYYCTIFAATESAREPGLIWAGSDDGLLHVSRDNGVQWENVTTNKLPEWSMINSLEVSPWEDGVVYVAVTRYKLGDYRPMLYKVSNYGKQWALLSEDLPSDDFTRVIRCAPAKPGLLFAGTERTVWCSTNDGGDWDSLKLNLPIVPITDLAVKENDLIAATQGRSFWILDDISPLYDDCKGIEAPMLLSPSDAYRLSGYGGGNKTSGKNRPGGVFVDYYVPELSEEDTLTLTFVEEDGEVIKTFSSHPEEDQDKLSKNSGWQRFIWNMRYPDVEEFEGMWMWFAGMDGPMAPPGSYKVVMDLNGERFEECFSLLSDPRSEVSDEALVEQFAFCWQINRKVSEAHVAIRNIRTLKEQIAAVEARTGEEDSSISVRLNELKEGLSEVEETLYQVKLSSNQDMLNYPIKLTNKLGHVGAITQIGNYPPTNQARAVANELTMEVDKFLTIFYDLFENEVAALNKAILDARLPALLISESDMWVIE